MPLHFPKGTPGDALSAKIPKIVHFVFGYKLDEEPVLNFVNYVAIASALAVIRPQVVMVHCPQEPVGMFWELLRPHVKLVLGRKVDSIFGKPVESYAHKADIVRLEALLEHGGIYLDIDAVILKPFDELLGYDTVMGEEGEGGRVGLCNAIILAAKDSKFIREWYSRYASFNKDHWNYHSVMLPMELAKDNPSYIHRVNYMRFFWPLWDSSGMTLMMASFDYDYTSNLAVHVWNHGLERSPYKDFSMDWCFECHSSLVSMLRSFVPDPLFSVVMPCYNQGRYIKDALKSILDQTFPNWEIIVVDDTSNDRCGDIARNYANRHDLGARFKLIKNTDNLGLAETRNMAVKHARGIWICALDPDDKVHKGYFRAAVQAMSLQPDLQLITSNQQFFEGSNWVWEVPPFDTATVMKKGPLPVMTLYLRSLWEKVGGYTNALPWGNEDYDFWTKLLALGVKAHKLPGVLVYYRYKQKSMMRDSAVFAQEERAMMRTMHPGLYHVSSLLEQHVTIMNMSSATRKRLEDRQKAERLSLEDRSFGLFWLALSDMRAGDFDSAMRKLSDDVLQVEKLRWQASFHRARCVCRVHGPTASMPLMVELARKYKPLALTIQFALQDRNCRNASRWLAPPRARDA